MLASMHFPQRWCVSSESTKFGIVRFDAMHKWFRANSDIFQICSKMVNFYNLTDSIILFNKTTWRVNMQVSLQRMIFQSVT